MLRVNLRSGRLELENDRYAESSYESEVRWGSFRQACGRGLLQRTQFQPESM